MLDALETIFGFIIGTVVLKGIIAHMIGDYIVKWAKYWLKRQPHRVAYYKSLLAYHRTKAGIM